MKSNISRFCQIALLCFSALGILGCKEKTMDPNQEFGELSNYFDDSNRHITNNIDVGGVNSLTLKQENNLTTLENQKVRIILNQNGSIREYVNKENKLYFTKDTPESDPIHLDLVSQNGLTPDSYSYQEISNTSDLVKIQYVYTFNDYGVAKTSIALAKDSDEVIFKVNLTGLSFKTDRSVLDVEYPIVSNIKTLKNKESDVFASPYATGFLFKNPIDNFNSDYGIGIGKSMGTYPTGWYYTMQFATYYSENLGGFYWTTRDAGDFIKSFSFVGTGNDDLKMSIFHYVDDLSDTSVDFDYDIVIGNNVTGRWQESALRYKKWAVAQPFITQMELVKDREDINKDLYEKTTLSYFGFRCDVSTWTDMIMTYDQIRSRIHNNVMNIAIYQNKPYFDIAREYGDYYSVFEFNSISPLEKFANNAIKDKNYHDTYFSVNGTPFFYQCPKSEEWLENRNLTEQGYYDTYQVDALYFDVAFTAIHPIQCFETNHSHGTRINVLDGFYHQLDNASKLGERNGFYSVGTEMLTERTISYIDFYQARANGGPLGWMESDEIRGMVEDNVAIKVPMFDLVYHEYGAVRMDGYLVPLDELGNSYYYIAGYTALNGGIPEFNYEYFPTNTLPNANRINIDMVDYIDKLGQMRTGYGKDYIVYGEMLDAPNIGTGLATYDYEQPNYSPSSIASTGRSALFGTWSMDQVVVSAYKSSKSNNVGIFLTNITENAIQQGFKLQAMRDYGIESGDIYLTSSRNNERRKVASFNNGVCNIGLNMQSHEIYMLEIVAK